MSTQTDDPTRRRRIISFDIGIRNMAYCIFDTTPSSISRIVDIADWSICNFLQEVSQNNATANATANVANTVVTNESCCQCRRKGKYFTMARIPPGLFAAAAPTQTTEPSRVVLCETHGTEWCTVGAPAGYDMDKGRRWKWTKTQSKHIYGLKDNDDDERNNACREHGWAIPLTVLTKAGKPKALTRAEWQAYVDKFALRLLKETTTSTKIERGGRADQLDLITFGQRMRDLLDGRPIMTDGSITDVIIENQISPLASRMKTVQGMVAQYFIMRTPNAKIHFVSSGNKLRELTKTHISTPATPTITTSTASANPAYRKHKLDGVHFCSQFLKATVPWRDGNWGPWFHQVKGKRDDLADSFLQGLVWMKTNKLVEYTTTTFEVSSYGGEEL